MKARPSLTSTFLMQKQRKNAKQKSSALGYDNKDNNNNIASNFSFSHHFTLLFDTVKDFMEAFYNNFIKLG